jgi:hypothetical protein
LPGVLTEPTLPALDRIISMRYPVLPVVSAIAAILVLVPLPSQLRRRNVATLSLIIGTFLLHVAITVNTLVWAGNVRDSAPVWCDICQFHSICIPREFDPPITIQPARFCSRGPIQRWVLPCALLDILNGSRRHTVGSQKDRTACSSTSHFAVSRRCSASPSVRSWLGSISPPC